MSADTQAADIPFKLRFVQFDRRSNGALSRDFGTHFESFWNKWGSMTKKQGKRDSHVFRRDMMKIAPSAVTPLVVTGFRLIGIAVEPFISLIASTLGPRELVDQLARQQAELQFELDQLSKRAEAFSSKTSFYAALTSGLATAAALVATSNLLPSSQELLFTAFLAVLATLAVSLALTGLWREKRKEVASLEMALEMYRYLAVKLKTELEK